MAAGRITRNTSQSQHTDDMLICQNVTCGKEIRVDNNDSHLKCQLCFRHFHRVCTGMSAAFNDEMKKLHQVTWFCSFCKPRADDILYNVSSLRDDHDNLAKAHQELVERVEKLETTPPVAPAPLYSSAANSAPNHEPARNSMSRMLNEIQDIAHRKSNLVFYGVKECESTVNSERISHDREKVSEIVNKMDHPVEVNANVKAVIRLGEKEEGKDRPLKVVFANESEKVSILRAAKSLHEKVGFKRIFVKPDLTKLQQQQQLKLWEKVKEKRLQEATLNLFISVATPSRSVTNRHLEVQHLRRRTREMGRRGQPSPRDNTTSNNFIF